MKRSGASRPENPLRNHPDSRISLATRRYHWIGMSHSSTDNLQSRRRARRALLTKVLLGLLVLGGLGGTAIVFTMNRGSGGEVAVDDRYRVKVTSFDMTIPATGEIEALTSVEIRNQVEGRTLIKWIIEEGSRVSRGDLLVEITSDEIVNRIEEETLRVESARSDLVSAQEAVALQESQNRSTEGRAQLAVDLAELELKRWQEGEVATRRKDLQVRLQLAERNAEQRAKDYANSLMLFKEGFISESEKVTDQNRLDEARAELEKAQLANHIYNEYEYPKDLKAKTSDLDETRVELERVQQSNARTLEQKKADLINKERQLSIRESRLAKLQEQLLACTIRAPGDGLVVYGTSVGRNPWRREAPLQIGQEIHANQLLIILPDTTELVASVRVHETQSSRVSVGMPATVKIDALPKLQLKARVRSVGVMAEQNGFGSQVREYTIRLLIQGPNEWDLKPSMRCKADILLGRVEEVIAVPIQAVFVERGRPYVWVPSGSMWTQRPVTTGRNSETMIEIKSGLDSGDVVLLRAPGPGETDA